MRRTTITALALLALAVSVAGVARPARADIVYTLKDLGTLGGAVSQGQGVNDSGQVTGFFRRSDQQYRGPRVPVGPRRRGAQGPRHPPRRDLQRGFGVNASGQVTGFANPTAISSNHAPSP